MRRGTQVEHDEPTQDKEKFNKELSITIKDTSIKLRQSVPGSIQSRASKRFFIRFAIIIPVNG